MLGNVIAQSFNVSTNCGEEGFGKLDRNLHYGSACDCRTALQEKTGDNEHDVLEVSVD